MAEAIDVQGEDPQLRSAQNSSLGLGADAAMGQRRWRFSVKKSPHGAMTFDARSVVRVDFGRSTRDASQSFDRVGGGLHEVAHASTARYAAQL